MCPQAHVAGNALEFSVGVGGGVIEEVIDAHLDGFYVGGVFAALMELTNVLIVISIVPT